MQAIQYPMRIVEIPTWYYEQFDADFNMEIPGEGYGGWKQEDLPLNLDKTAIVVMHAHYCGTRTEFPGWHRAVEYIPRSYTISKEVFPGILNAARNTGIKVYHVVAKGDFYKDYPGYKVAKRLAQRSHPLEKMEHDDVIRSLTKFKNNRAYPGAHNIQDIQKGYENINFLNEARPLCDEGIAETSDQLFGLCKRDGINHLIYMGFAINWCLLTSPGGMVDMSRRGIMCSAIRQGVTAVENRETAREQLNKEEGLWRVALAFGFVYDVDDLIYTFYKNGW